MPPYQGGGDMIKTVTLKNHVQRSSFKSKRALLILPKPLGLVRLSTTLIALGLTEYRKENNNFLPTPRNS